ncbi:MAG TPA: DNA cytosine methyltransferase [Candidatus Sulfopaludibacter sp.]|nr:DNA cytosine methyltransferase [Candidatus Sulfopaludibacter sp.]
MKLISFQKLGENRASPRLWLESRRLETFGFSAGIPFSVEQRVNGIWLRPAVLSNNHVSKRMSAGRERPIIDIANRSLLSPLDGFSEIKVTAAFQRIDVVPSVRGFHIRRCLEAKPLFRTIEAFCGGGTLSAAIAGCRDLHLIAGLELEPKYADVWQQAHPNAILYQADIRRVHPTELPAHEILVASIPCTSHSTLGRAKKSLAGKPELGDTGDLFLSVAHIIAHHLPSACIFENVPAFANSLACLSLAQHLQKIGYFLTETIIEPLNEWNEPQDRKRWIIVATLKPGFQICSPQIPFTGTVGEFLDSPADSDRREVERIVKSIEALCRHNQRHAKLGHGFGFTTINRESVRVPTIVRSYHKINTGPFVETPYGLRLLHKVEVERLMGCKIDCDHYATAIEILGQGVQTRIFREILRQLAEFLKRVER